MKALVGALCVTFSACGPKSPPTTTAERAQPASPDVPFAKLDHRQQVEFMKQKVVPAMKPVFQQHDPDRYAKFGCDTCHGAGAAIGKFDMPNGDLPKLTKDMKKFDAGDVEWMTKQVEPTMATLLQRPTWSESHPDGFACVSCHTIDPGS
jgi:hypothetical protein